MYDIVIILAAIIGAVTGVVTISRYLYFTKAEINEKFTDLKKESDIRDEHLNTKIEETKTELKTELVELKDKLYEKLTETERQDNKTRLELYEKLSQYTRAIEDYNQNMLKAMSQLKQEQNDLSTNFIQLIGNVKDELKNDYICRYNDLLNLIGTKTNMSDFDRLETKFDKVTETITELKTIVQLQLDKEKK